MKYAHHAFIVASLGVSAAGILYAEPVVAFAGLIAAVVSWVYKDANK